MEVDLCMQYTMVIDCLVIWHISSLFFTKFYLLSVDREVVGYSAFVCAKQPVLPHS